MHEIFKTNPNLKQVHMTSDGEAFYSDNDAKLHAKSLKDKTVELVVNPSFLEVFTDEDIAVAPKTSEGTGEENNGIEAKADGSVNELNNDSLKEDALKDEADLEKVLAEFDPETAKYPEALKLFKALGLEAENEKKDTIYPLLVAEKAKALEGSNTQE